MIRFFVCNDVLSLIDNKIHEIEIMIDTITPENAKSNFIYAYSIFESAITEIVRYYLRAFPEKIKKIDNISKEDLLSTTMVNEIILKKIDSYIRHYSCDTLPKYLSFCNETLAIDTILDTDEISNISSIRNTINHDNAKFELVTVHIHSSSKSELSCPSICKYMYTLKDYLQQYKIGFEKKYKKYTLEELLRNVWKHVFSSPLLTFDNIWKFDDKGVLLIQDIDIVKSRISEISSSERLLLSIFLQQYSGGLNQCFFSFQDLPALVSLDYENKNKLVEIISFFEYYPLLFNGEKII